jgi:hypothetical protein
MRQEQPTRDFNRSDWAILAGLFVLLGFVMALAIHLGYLTELFQAAQAVIQKVQAHVAAVRNP